MPAFPAKIIKCRYLWKKFHTIKQSIFLIFYYIEYDYIALSPDQYNFFLKKFVSYFTECKCFFLVVTVFLLLLKLGLKYIGVIKYKNIYIKKITCFLIVLFFEMDIPHCFAFCCNNEYTLHTYIHAHALQHFHTS